MATSLSCDSEADLWRGMLGRGCRGPPATRLLQRPPELRERLHAAVLSGACPFAVAAAQLALPGTAGAGRKSAALVLLGRRSAAVGGATVEHTLPADGGRVSAQAICDRLGFWSAPSVATLNKPKSSTTMWSAAQAAWRVSATTVAFWESARSPLPFVSAAPSAEVASETTAAAAAVVADAIAADPKTAADADAICCVRVIPVAPSELLRLVP